MKFGRVPVLMVLVACSVMLLASGCGAAKQEPDVPEHEGEPDTDQGPLENGYADARDPGVKGEPPGPEGEKPKPDLGISSTGEVGSANGDERSGGEAAAGKAAEGNPEAAADAGPQTFNRAKPDLLGIAIGDSRDAVIRRFGPPISSYPIEDPESPLDVLRYSHFAIGVNAAGQVEFIDVFSPQIDPGLNGVRIGSPADDAVLALGEPTNFSEYVMSYNFGGAVLKFDLDPDTRQITSIKLFVG